jgi:hypothetical protein
MPQRGVQALSILSRGITSRKVAGSRIYLILAPTLGLGVYSTSNRNEYQKQKNVLGSRARPVRRADKLIAICEPIVPFDTTIATVV